MRQENIKNITSILGKLGITKAAHLWISFDEKIERTRGITNKMKDSITLMLETLHEASLVIENLEANPDL